MADLKRWFKVWTAILDDPHHVDLSLEDVGRWTRLGAMTALSGKGGRLVITPPAKRLLQVLETDTVSDAKVAIKRLPNVSIEEGLNVNGEFTVTWRNWTKYQADTTIAARVKRLRRKRRGEEKRGEQEEKRGEETAPATSTFRVNEEIQAALKQAPRLGAVPRLWSVEFWRAEVRANGDLDLPLQILKAEAWLVANPTRAPKKNLVRFLHNWLTRTTRDEDPA